MDNPDYPRLVELYAKRGRPLPDDLGTPPEVLPGYQPWVEAFAELGSERQLGFGGVGPIPRSAILAYTSGWPSSEADFFLKVIRELDATYRSHGTEYAELPAEAQEASSDNPARDAFRAVMRNKGK